MATGIVYCSRRFRTKDESTSVIDNLGLVVDCNTIYFYQLSRLAT